MWHVAAEAVESEIIVRYFLSSSRLGLIMPLLGVCRIWKFINDLANAFPSDPTEEVVATREC